MSVDLATIRVRAAEHQDALDMGTTYLTPIQIAERWHCHPSTVRDIPRDELPYLEIGRGRVNRRRRYHPRDVAAYEAGHR